MQPEHEQFLLDHMKQLGCMFVIDRLKSQFPTLTHKKACDIYKEFEKKHSEDSVVKRSKEQLNDMGKKIGDFVEKQIRETIK